MVTTTVDIVKEITIRSATVDDASPLLEIYSYYVKNTAITFEWEVPSVEEFSSRIENTLKNYPYLVAEIDGQPVGYAYASRFRTRAAYAWCVETSIYVHKDFRGQGIGRALLEKLESLLKEQGVLNIYAGITYLKKEDEYLTHASPKFHKKMGYKKVAKYQKCGFKFNRWYDLIFMEKFLGEHTENPEPVKPNVCLFSFF